MRAGLASVAAAAWAVCAATVVCGQPLPIDPGIALGDAQAAYTSGPWCERAVVSVRRVTGGLAAELAAAAEAEQAGAAGLPSVRDRSERRADVVVCWEPRAQEAGGGRGWMELGELRVVIEGGVLTAVHARSPGVYVQEWVSGEEGQGGVAAAALARVLPPVPVPGLDFAVSGKGAPVRGMTAYAPDVQWLSAVVDDAAGPRRIRLTGRGGHGVVSMVTDAASGRVQEFACDASAPDAEGQQTVVVVRAQALPLESRPAWMKEPLVLHARERVSSLRALAPARPTELRPGQTVAGLPLLTREGTPWSPAMDLGPVGDDGALLVLLFVRAGEPLAVYKRVADEVRVCVREIQGMRVGFRPVLVAELADRDLDRRVKEAAEALGEGLLWTVSPAATLDRFAPAGSRAALVVLDGQRRLVGGGVVEEVEGAREVLEWLRESAEEGAFGGRP